MDVEIRGPGLDAPGTDDTAVQMTGTTVWMPRSTAPDRTHLGPMTP